MLHRGAFLIGSPALPLEPLFTELTSFKEIFTISRNAESRINAESFDAFPDTQTDTQPCQKGHILMNIREQPQTM